LLQVSFNAGAAWRVFMERSAWQKWEGADAPVFSCCFQKILVDLLFGEKKR
jgi:hypothetical protein